MVYQERNAWSTLVVSTIAAIVYTIVILQQSGAHPLADIDWAPVMLWTIGISIVTAIALAILWGLAAKMREPDEAGRTDERDRDISHLGERVGQAFLVIGGLTGLVLCAIEADSFWIANALFFGFALSAIVGALARVIAYRRGLV